MLIKELYDVIDELAPFKYSKEIVAAGGYDNSGVILDTGKEFKKVLFSLDLSLAAVRRAKRQGAGAGYAEEIYKNGGINADVIITADMPHHLIREFVESGYAIVLFTHYATENYGFKKFFDNVSVKLNGKAETVMFTDDRFI